MKLTFAYGICLLFLLESFVVRVHGAKINFLIIADKMNSRPKTSCRSAAEKLGADVEIALVDIEPEMTEADICKAILEKMAAPTLAIDTTTGNTAINRVSDLVKLVVRKLHIPTVSVTPTYAPWPGAPLTDTEKEYFLKVLPPELAMASIIKSIVSVNTGKDKIRSFMVAHDETFPLQNKVGLIFDNIPCAIALESFDEKPETIEIFLNKVGKSDVGNIFLLGKVSTINAILSKASEKEMFKPQYGWFAMTKDEKNIECKKCVNGSVIFIKGEARAAELDELKKSGALSDEIIDNAFYYDLTKGILDAIKGEVGKEGGWPEALTYPECGADATEEQIAERANVKLKTILEPITIKGVYGDIVLKAGASKKALPYQNINLQLSHFAMNGDERITAKGKWTRDMAKSPVAEFDSTALADIKEHKAIPMLRITTVIEPPFIYEVKNAKGETIGYEGFCIDMLNEIRAKANWDFQYRITVTKDNLHGDMHEIAERNISWSGMIGDIVNGSADIALGPIAVMAERETAVDFTVPFYDLVGVSILMKKNEPKSSLFKFLTVLEANVWACIIGAYFFTSFLMFLFDRLSPYSYHNNKEKYKDDEETRDFSLKESLWFCITSLTPQGGGEAPRNLSGRLVAATWWLFGFIIIASYTANLAAFLTVSRLDSTIESLEDLAKQYKIKYAPVEGSTSKTYFERMAAIEERFYEIWKNMSLDDSLNETERAKLAVWDYPVSDKYTKIWWTMKETTFVKTLQEGIDKVLASKGPQDGFALIAESTQVRYAAMMNCQLNQVGNEFSRRPLALALPKGSEIRERLSNAILELLNERKFEALKDKWWTNNPYRKKCYDKTKQGDGIAIENIGGVFIVIFIGIVLAILTLIIEFLYFKGKRSSTRVITVKDFSTQSKDPLRRDGKNKKR